MKINNSNQINNSKSANISKISSLISPRSSKSVLAKSKYYLKNYLFTQAVKENIEKTLKIKKLFPKLSSSKIIEI